MRQSQIRFFVEQGYRVPGDDSGWYSALRVQPAIVGLVVLLGAALQSAVVFFALALVLWWNALLPTVGPFELVLNRRQRARGLPLLPPAPSPRRFAQGLAGLMAVVIATALLLGASLTAWIVEALLAAAAAMVVFAGRCAGSALFNALQRIRTRRRTRESPTQRRRALGEPLPLTAAGSRRRGNEA